MHSPCRSGSERKTACHRGCRRCCAASPICMKSIVDRKHSRPDGRVPCQRGKSSLRREKNFPAPTVVEICRFARTAPGLQHNSPPALAALTRKLKKIAAKFPAPGNLGSSPIPLARTARYDSIFKIEFTDRHPDAKRRCDGAHPGSRLTRQTEAATKPLKFAPDSKREDPGQAGAFDRHAKPDQCLRRCRV